MSVLALDAMVARALARAEVARLAGDDTEVACELAFAYNVRQIEARQTAEILSGLEADLLDGDDPQ